ncbi:hypothetical protein [Ralstonia solanacearum]|nr:hypothetical protein [Ralstonia solanacearum]
MRKIASDCALILGKDCTEQARSLLHGLIELSRGGRIARLGERDAGAA